MSIMTKTAEQQIQKGLAGVLVDTTKISKVNPETKSLLYRGYPVPTCSGTASYPPPTSWTPWSPPKGPAGRWLRW
jgi:citrate synthase